MQLHYLLVVVVVSDVKVMSSTVAVTFAVINYSAITRVVNNNNIRTKPHFLNRTKLIPNRIRVCFSKNRTKIKKIYSAHRYSLGKPMLTLDGQGGNITPCCRLCAIFISASDYIDYQAALFYSSVDFTDASHWYVHRCIELSTDERNKTTPWWINHTTWHLF